jgi:two-component system NtrC family response regulator
VQHFLIKFRARHSRADLTMEPGLMKFFTDYEWPGNVRELENAVERMVLLARGNELTHIDLPDFLRPQTPQIEASTITIPEHINLEEMEKEMIVQALKKCEGNQTRAARFLGISRRTLAYRLEKHGIHGDVLRVMKHGSA